MYYDHNAFTVVIQWVWPVELYVQQWHCQGIHIWVVQQKEGVLFCFMLMVHLVQKHNADYRRAFFVCCNQYFRQVKSVKMFSLKMETVQIK